MTPMHALRSFCLSLLLVTQAGLTAVAADDGFIDLFDGRTLAGWKAADPSFWSVEDGAITAKITGDHPLKENLYLIWQGGEPADFELTLTHRVSGSEGINCGFQFRSRELPNHDVAGYQVDNNLNTDWLVRLYDEHGRHTLAWRGEHTVFDRNGQAQTTAIPDAKGPPWFRLEDWHEYRLRCQGPHLTLYVNGRLAAGVVDRDPAQQDFKGILALQLHTGPPTVAQFKDIRLKVLEPGTAATDAAASSEAEASRPPLMDKTLVAWVSPANLDQRGGSVLTIDDLQSHFDGVVFGELAPRKWMPGSDLWRRTQKEQSDWPEETAESGTFVQVAIAYQGTAVTVFRNAQPVVRYTMSNPPQAFGPAAAVLFGRRHLDAGDPDNSFEGRIRDARIYAQALNAETLAALKPAQAASGNEPTPWAWWSFADEGLREKTGRFTGIKLIGDVRINEGCLVLGGKGATVVCTCPGDEDGTRLSVPKQWSFDSAVPDEVVRSTRLFRERLLADPNRPRYHFCLPEDMGQPGDPNGAFFANGRYHLMYLLLTDNPPGEKEQGWSGVYGLPRLLWLGDDGTLRMRPADELRNLRGSGKSWTEMVVTPERPQTLEGVMGRSCELELEVGPGPATRCGLKVRASPDGS